MPVPSERDLKSAVAIPRLEAVIRQVRWLSVRVGQCATWKDPNAALIALLAWNVSCLFFWTIVIYAIPALPLLWATRTWPKPKSNDNTKVPLGSTLSSTIDTPSTHTVVDWLVAVEGVIQTSLDALCWSKNPARTRRTFILLIYFYVLWVTAHQIADTRYILATIGTLTLTWQSPWLIQLRGSSRYPISIFTAVFLGPLQEMGVSGLMQRAQTHQENAMNRVAGGTDFTFVLVENQRYLGQWQSTSLPFDRAPWTDESNQPISSKTAFELPLPSVQPTTKEVDYQASWIWRWVDMEWRLEQSSRTDELGWEYGTIMWTMFDRESKGVISTRRRRWTRRATLEYRVEMATSPLPQKPLPNRIQVPSLSRTNNSNNHNTLPLSRPPSQPPTQLHEDTGNPLSPTSHFVDSFTSPVTSIFGNIAENGRRDTFGVHRQNQSSTTIAGEPEHIRRRTTSAYTSQLTDTFVSLDTPLQSSTSSSRNVSRDSKRSRDAIWKSIVRN